MIIELTATQIRHSCDIEKKLFPMPFTIKKETWKKHIPSQRLKSSVKKEFLATAELNVQLLYV